MRETIKCTKKVAILLATFNGERYLKEQLDSLLRQSTDDFVCYIHDDGSSDGTYKIIREYSDKFPEKIVEIPGAPCGGSKNNFLYLLRIVEADYYMFCDQDDVWNDNKIEIFIDGIGNTSEQMPMCIYTDLLVVDEDLKVISNSFYTYSGLDPSLNTYKYLLMSNVCVGCTMGFNRCLRDIIVPFESANIMMHDWGVALVASVLGNLYYIAAPTIQYRQHTSNVLGAALEKNLLKKFKQAFSIKEFIKRRQYYKTRSIRMANDLLELPGIDEEKKAFLHNFSTISSRNKIQRIIFYTHNDLYRQRINKIWQLMGI